MFALETVTSLAQRALLLSLELALPVLAVGLVVGLAVGVVQTVTGIQEHTLSFVLKVVSMAGAVVLLLPWILSLATTYASSVLGQLVRMAAP